MYRPKGWAKIKRDLCHEELQGVGGADCKTCPAKPLTCNTSGEKMVDAMLGGLKEEGDYYPKGRWTDDSTFETDVAGYVIFIQEE